MEALKPLIGRTKEEFDEYMKNDLLISIMKALLQGSFGGLWIFLLFTTTMGAYTYTKDLLGGLSTEELNRKYRLFRKTEARVKLAVFIALQLLGTGIFLCLPIGRSILSNGVVVFALGYIVYVNWPNRKGKNDEYQLQKDILSLENRSNVKDLPDFEPVILGDGVSTESSNLLQTKQNKQAEKDKKNKRSKLKAN
jgi:hypothetical protein